MFKDTGSFTHSNLRFHQKKGIFLKENTALELSREVTVNNCITYHVVSKILKLTGLAGENNPEIDFKLAETGNNGHDLSRRAKRARNFLVMC